MGATVKFQWTHAATRALILHKWWFAGDPLAATHADASVEKLAVGTGSDFAAVAATPDPWINDAVGDFINRGGGIENGKIVDIFLVW